MGFLYKTTTSDFSSGPPSNPSTGDIWIASNVDANGTRWQFQYNAGSASAYKWEFIGGAPVLISVDTFETTTSAWPTLVDLTTVGPSFTPARSGDYAYLISVRANNNTANVATVTEVKWNNTANTDSSQLVTTSSTANADETGSLQGLCTGCTAGQVIKMMYSTLSSGTATFGGRRMWITPVRVS